MVDSKHQITIINSPINDSTEDWILDDMISDSMKPFFEWSRQYPDDVVTFTKEIDTDAHYHCDLKIVAHIDDDAIAAQLLLEFDLPVTTLSWNITEHYGTHNG